MKQNKETLKEYFETGDKPTQEQYSDLIDSYIDSQQEVGEDNRRFVIDETGEVALASALEIPEYSLSDITNNKITLLKDGEIATEIDLTSYIDDTNLARLVSGSVDENGLATFSRDDETTFTVDFSSIIPKVNETQVDLVNNYQNIKKIENVQVLEGTANIEYNSGYIYVQNYNSDLDPTSELFNLEVGDTVYIEGLDGEIGSIVIDDYVYSDSLGLELEFGSNNPNSIIDSNGNVILEGNTNFTDNTYTTFFNLYIQTTTESTPTNVADALSYLDDLNIVDLQASNGLNKNGDNIKLGGEITEDIIFNAELAQNVNMQLNNVVKSGSQDGVTSYDNKSHSNFNEGIDHYVGGSRQGYVSDSKNIGYIGMNTTAINDLTNQASLTMTPNYIGLNRYLTGNNFSGLQLDTSSAMLHTINDSNETSFVRVSDESIGMVSKSFNTPLQIAPASLTDIGSVGEWRVTEDGIYICTDTDTWILLSNSTSAGDGTSSSTLEDVLNNGEFGVQSDTYGKIVNFFGGNEANKQASISVNSFAGSISLKGNYGDIGTNYLHLVGNGGIQHRDSNGALGQLVGDTFRASSSDNSNITELTSDHIKMTPVDLTTITATQGMQAVSNTDNLLKYYDGSTWLDLTGSGTINDSNYAKLDQANTFNYRPTIYGGIEVFGPIDVSGFVNANTITSTGQIETTGEVTASSYNLTSIETAPTSSTDTGIEGEIRYTSTGVYICIATNSWVNAMGQTF